MFSERLKRLKAYVPGEQPQDRSYIKVNTNESPYPPTPLIRQTLLSFDPERLRLYPDPKAVGLRRKLAETYGVREGQVFVSNGSDEALSFCFYAFFDPGRGKLLFPEFTYSFYPVYCDFYGIGYEKVGLAPDFRVDPERFLGRESCGIIFANPNAPTGIALPAKEIGSLLARYPQDRVVIVDEAYVDFGAESAIPLLKEHPNLLVVRTFSKSMSLAGLRLGFAIANEPLIEGLFTVKDSFNSYPLDQLALYLGEVALSDEAHYRSMREKIVKTRDRFCLRLRELGWTVLPSKTNFVFARKEGVAGKRVYEFLKSRGILVRHFAIPGIQDFVRITIGLDEDMDRLLQEVSSMK